MRRNSIQYRRTFRTAEFNTGVEAVDINDCLAAVGQQRILNRNFCAADGNHTGMVAGYGNRNCRAAQRRRIVKLNALNRGIGCAFNFINRTLEGLVISQQFRCADCRVNG